MGVTTKFLRKGAREINKLIAAEGAKRHKEFTKEVLQAAKDIAQYGVDNRHGTDEDKAYATGKFRDSLKMEGTPGKTMAVGSDDKKPKVFVIEYGSDDRGRFPKYIMGRAIGLAFDRTNVKAKGFRVLKGVVSAV